MICYTVLEGRQLTLDESLLNFPVYYKLKYFVMKLFRPSDFFFKVFHVQIIFKMVREAFIINYFSPFWAKFQSLKDCQVGP